MKTLDDKTTQRRTFWLIGCLLAAAFCVAALFVTAYIAIDKATVPFVNMWFCFEDIDHVASIHCPKFRIDFEGESFGTNTSGGNYVVDGRYPPRLFGFSPTGNYLINWSLLVNGPQPYTLRAEPGKVTSDYLPQERQALFGYQGHKIRYFHHLKSLEIDGRIFPLGEGQLRLLVRREEDIQESTIVIPPAVLESITVSAEKTWPDDVNNQQRFIEAQISHYEPKVSSPSK